MADALTAELDPGERVVWHAMPSLRYKTWNPVLMLLLVVLLAAFCGVAFKIFHFGEPLSSEPDKIVRDFVLHSRNTLIEFVFVNCGILLAVTAFSFLALRRIHCRTVYAVTDRRAIIVDMTLGKKIRSFAGDQLNRVTRVEGRRGGGDLLFGLGVGFRSIADPRAVAALLRQTAEQRAVA